VLESPEDPENPLSQLPHPHVSAFLDRLAFLAARPWAERRAALWELGLTAADELVDERGSAFGRFVRRTGRMTLLAGGGATALGALVVELGLVFPYALPAAAALGAAAGIGIGFWGAARARRIRLWPTTRACFEATQGSDLFSKVSLSPERSHGWQTYVVRDRGFRDLGLCGFGADNRIRGTSAEEALELVVDTLAFTPPDDMTPEGSLLPQVWSMVRAQLPEGARGGAVGRLEPVDESGRLGCWLSEEDLGAGALHDDILSPLSLALQKARRGPYR
jgi:hypothetical protein